jgi:hypothetical protein
MKNLNEANPKIDPAPNSNTQKEPDEWVSGDDPMTGAQPPTSRRCPRNAPNLKRLRRT